MDKNQTDATNLSSSRERNDSLEGIFISYRRDDARHISERIYEVLKREMPEARVFIDEDDIGLGEDFREAIRIALGRTKVMLVLIGKTWAKTPGYDGKPRLEAVDDPVRFEIQTALDCKIEIIPVLVNDAHMPRGKELPESLEWLSYINGTPVGSGPRFADDMARLVRRLKAILEKEKSSVSGDIPAQPIRKLRSRVRPIAWGVAVVGVGAFCGSEFQGYNYENRQMKLLEEFLNPAENSHLLESWEVETIDPELWNPVEEASAESVEALFQQILAVDSESEPKREINLAIYIGGPISRLNVTQLSRLAQAMERQGAKLVVAGTQNRNHEESLRNAGTASGQELHLFNDLRKVADLPEIDGVLVVAMMNHSVWTNPVTGAVFQPLDFTNHVAISCAAAGKDVYVFFDRDVWDPPQVLTEASEKFGRVVWAGNNDASNLEEFLRTIRMRARSGGPITK